MDCEWTALSPPSIPWLRCPWARHWTPNCSPGAGAMAALCSGCVFTVCVFTTHCCVCALGWVKCRAPISSMGHHTWQYITLLLLLYYYHMSLMSLCLSVCSCSDMNGLMCSSHALWGLISWTWCWSGFCGSGETDCWDLHRSCTGGHSQQHLCFLCDPCTRRLQVGQSQGSSDLDEL